MGEGSPARLEECTDCHSQTTQIRSPTLFPNYRKRKLFAQQDLPQLIRQEGLDIQTSSVFKLDVFDNTDYESRLYSQWVPKTPGQTCLAFSPRLHAHLRTCVRACVQGEVSVVCMHVCKCVCACTCGEQIVCMCASCPVYGLLGAQSCILYLSQCNPAFSILVSATLCYCVG